MPTSFYLFLIGSIIAFLPAYWDHGKTWQEVKKHVGNKKRRSIVKLMVLWAIPISGLTGTIFLGIESANEDIQGKKRDQQYSVVTNSLSQDEARLESRADRLRRSDFKNLVRGNASGEIEILYAPYDGEAAGFAVELYNELSQAGWKMVGFKPKPADLEPTWASPRPLVPESFASIAITSHDPNDEKTLRWQMVPLDTKLAGTNEDMALIHWDFSGSKPKVEKVDRYQHRMLPAGIGAAALATALENSGFHSERNIDTNTPPDKILVVIGAKE